VRERLETWGEREDGSRVLFVRRPDRRGPEATVMAARSDEDGGELRRLLLPSLEALPEADLDAGERLGGPLVLVCVHGRRDPCCARLGVPVFDALAADVAPQLLWQSSHQGGHRFAANVLALPAGISLGRVAPESASAVAAQLRAGQIPLEHFRGRTIHPPPAQAAETAVRSRLGLRALGDVRVLEVDSSRVALQTPDGLLDVVVETTEGPSRPESCAAEPVPATAYTVRW
jgi:Sucrase/ferredoxin-like